MSATYLFRDAEDVSFRLNRTWLVFGKSPCFIHHVSLNGPSPEGVILHLNTPNRRDIALPLRLVPLHAMYYFPCGYVDSGWVSRGPARTYRQGIVSESIWILKQNGSICWGNRDYDVGGALTQLVRQSGHATPKQAALRKIVTKYVMKGSEDKVLLKGLPVGALTGNREVELYKPLAPTQMKFLRDASFKVKGETRD